jgi:plasmid maintenance system antidote protein VapI
MSYDPPFHKLIDFLIKEYDLKSDAALARALGIASPAISKLRHRTSKFTAHLILIVHKKTGMSVEDIESMLETQRIADEFYKKELTQKAHDEPAC